MNDRGRPDTDRDERADDLREAVVAADDTGMVGNEIRIVRTEIAEAEGLPPERSGRPD